MYKPSYGFDCIMTKPDWDGTFLGQGAGAGGARPAVCLGGDICSGGRLC